MEFNLNGIMIEDDVFVRCKHFVSNEIRLPIFRFMINTLFVIGDKHQLLKQHIDFSNNVTIEDTISLVIEYEILNEQDCEKKTNEES